MHSLFISRGGETGRRTGLKIQRSQDHEGSIPSRGTHMKKFFDLIITILLIITAYPAVILLYSRKKRKNSWEFKHQKLALFLAVFLLLGTITLTYGSFIEPNILVTTYQEINLNKFSTPIKIAIVADIQGGNFIDTKKVEKMVDRVISLKPNLVFLAGDLVDNEGTTEDETIYLKPLEKLAKIIPTYAVEGNHEYGIGGGSPVTNPSKRTGDISRETKISLEKMGIVFLQNNLEKITVNKENFYLFGGDELWSDKLDWSPLKKRTENIPTIALIHNPAAIFQTPGLGIDLMISGHTHGGQIRLPFLGPLGRTGDGFPTEWYEGWHEYLGTQFFVSRGAGESGARARLFCPPEIVLLTIN